MSGGAFNYSQYHIGYIIEEIQSRLETRDFTPVIRETLKVGLHKLEVAQIYAQRIDWYLSGDDGEDSFLQGLQEDLTEYSNKTKQHETL